MKKELTDDQYLDLLIKHDGNLELVIKIKEYTRDNFDVDESRIIESFSKEHLISKATVYLLDDFVFPVLVAVFILQDEPSKCIRLIKSVLKKLETGFAEFLLSLLLSALEDTRRFQDEPKFIIQELSKYDCSELPSERISEEDTLEYVLKNNVYADFDKWTSAIFQVRGYLKTDQEIFEDFVDNNPKRFNRYLESKKNTLSKIQTNTESKSIKYLARHYVLAYLIECNSLGVSYPVGKKTELEQIGNQRIGPGKGNRFYKVFNDIIKGDLNAENNLIEIGGENWREIVIMLSKEPEKVEQFLQKKQL